MTKTNSPPPWAKLLPGGIFTTARAFGGKELASRMVRMAWACRRPFFELLKTRGPTAAYNYFYTKTFVPVGEGAGAAAYFALGPILRKHPHLAPFPRYIEIETTTICDKVCIHCEHTYWKDQEERHLSFEEFKSIITQFPDLRWAHLTGEGSAFLNKDYIKMLAWLKERDIAVYLVDHFGDLDEEILRELIRLKINGIYISVDGATKETYEKIRVGCDFDKAVGNIRRLLELKHQQKALLPEINFRYVILSENVHEMPQFLDLVDSFGDRTYWGGDVRVGYVGNLEFEQIRHLSVDTIPKETYDQVIARKAELGLNVFLSHIEKRRNPSIGQCICWLEPYILMGGHVLPCCTVLLSNRRSFLRKHAFGNVHEQSMSEIWNSERYKRFRWLVNKPDQPVPIFCVGCRVFDTEERVERYGIEE